MSSTSSPNLPMSAASSTSNSLIGTNPPSQIRPEMVTAAIQFMANPRVRQTRVAEQKEFLRGKGLSEEEIEAAFSEIGSQQQGGSQQQLPQTSYGGQAPLQPAQMNSNGQSSGNTITFLLEMTKNALVLGSAGFMFYRFVRSWLLPHLLGVPDPAEERMQRLEEQIALIGDSNRAVAASITEQNEQISRTLLIIQGLAHHKGGDQQQEQLLAELGILKSLLLNQNQFPPIPESALKNGRAKQNGGIHTTSRGGGIFGMPPKIPDWQLALGNGTEQNGGSGFGEEENGIGNGKKEEDGEEEEELNRSSGSEV